MRTLWMLVGVAGIAGCAEPIEKLVPNRPPETLVTSGPPDSIDAVSARVHFQWTGEDPDGSIDHFEIILVDHPAAHDSITGDAINRVMVTVPRADDPRWTVTALVESTFVTLADTLRRDPQPGPGETPEDVRRRQLERWHTLFVRAVDDRGTPDATPDYRSFNARTLAPIVELLPPIRPGRAYNTPPTATFRWTGRDPLDEFETQSPDSSRWVLLPLTPGLYDWDPDYADTLYAVPDTAWSRWVAWNHEGGIGGVAEVHGLALIREDGDPRYLFAVQAMDEAGAVTTVFDWETPHKNNAVEVWARSGLSPILVLAEPQLGVLRVADAGSAILDVVAGAVLRFSWLADASHYNGRIVDCRFGWNMLNPDDPSSWSSCIETSQLPEMRIEAGTQRLTVEVTADNGVRSSATLILVAYSLTRQRRLLLVDNTFHVREGSDDEQREDERWLQVLEALAERAGFDFIPDQDVYDVATQFRFPPARRLLEYAAVIWHRNGAWWTHQEPIYPYDSQPRDTAVRSYLANGGGLWLTGFRPIRWFWQVGIEPFNVTNRAVPETPFPTDSLGVASLSYQLGVEMFEMGAGTGASREAYRHFCLGLRPAQPDAPMLVPGPNWMVSPDRPAVANIEIYNMPAALSAQVPPLRPAPWRSIVAYTYISGVPEDAANGVTFPRTADGQPVVMLTKRRSTDAHYTRAACGFDVMLLTEQSHLDLAEYILLHKFGLGTPPGVPNFAH